MRSKLIVLFASGSLALGSCANSSGEKNESAADSAAISTKSSTNMQSAESKNLSAAVPQDTRGNFESRYPQASNVVKAKGKVAGQKVKAKEEDK